MNCYETLKNRYDLKGYSPDTYLMLMEANLPQDECESLFAYLEVTYG